MDKDLAARLATVIAVNVTPFDEHGAVDRAAYERVVARMVDAGITALTANGNTGEFYSLDEAEAAVALDATLAAAGDKAVVIAGVGHSSAHAARMAASAQRAGAAAVMVHQPLHPYRSVDGWIAYHQAVADAAPEVGLVSYVRDPAINAQALAALARACPQLVAVKFAIPDPFALAKAIELAASDKLTWVCGLAERWTPFFWLAGARGFTSGLVNVAPELPLRLLRHLRDGDTSRAMQVWREVTPMEEMRARRSDANNVSALKEALHQLGLGARGIRPPSSELPDTERHEIAELLRQWASALTSSDMSP